MLSTLPESSVQCCVTSPPYWGLRDYGTAKWEGGDAKCDHSPEKRGGRFATEVSAKQASNTGSGTMSARECPCGARRIDAQLGLEETPDAYVANMVAVFRAVRRVLRDDGTLWLNLGDSYSGAAGGNNRGEGAGGGKERGKAMGFGTLPKRKDLEGGLKHKDLAGIPWRVAFALQADGWWLRQDIIWHKPNPMPESVADRCTKAHEYIFLLTKSARYYYDNEAVKERAEKGAAGSEFHTGKTGEHQLGRASTKPRANGVAKREDAKTDTLYDKKSTAGRLAMLRQQARENDRGQDSSRHRHDVTADLAKQARDVVGGDRPWPGNQPDGGGGEADDLCCAHARRPQLANAGVAGCLTQLLA